MGVKLRKQYLIWILCVLINLLMWANQSASASLCDFTKEPLQFHFEELPFKTIIDHSKSYEEIERLAREKSKEYVVKIEANIKKRMLANEVFRVEGLAHGLIDFHLRLTFKNKNVKDNSYCVYIKKAVLKVGFKEMTVYISRHIEKNSCRYTVVKKHEFEHVKRHTNSLASAIPSLKKLATVIKNTPIQHGLDKQQIHKDIQNEVLMKLQEISSKLERDSYIENAKFDTLENYRREAKVCISGATASKNNTPQFPDRVDP